MFGYVCFGMYIILCLGMQTASVLGISPQEHSPNESPGSLIINCYKYGRHKECLLQCVSVMNTLDSVDVWWQDGGYQAAEVLVTGDVEQHTEVTLSVTTPFSSTTLVLHRVSHPVFHAQLTTFTVVGEKSGVPDLRFETVSEEIHTKAKQFFYDLSSGAVVSIVHNKDNKHVEVKGFLDHETRISPPSDIALRISGESNSRFRREHRRRHHFVWKADDSLEWNALRRLGLDLESIVELEDDEDSHYGRSSVYKDDYLQVPDIFKDKSLWKRQQTGFRHISNNSSLDNNNGKPSWKHRRRRQNPMDTRQSSFQTTFMPHSSALPPEGHSSNVRATPNVTYVVDIMVMVDVKTYADFDFDAKLLEDYILHFWQAVNLRLQAIVDPRLQLKIRSYGKILFAEFQHFIENSRVTGGTQDVVSLDDVFEGFRGWMQNYESNTAYLSHDVAVLMTGENLCKKTLNGSCPDTPRGIGYMAGACITARRFAGYSYDVAVTEVDRSFRGVLTATHELGHLLNASHDGERDATPCIDSGNIMSYNWKNAHDFNRFSSCSKLSITKFLNQAWYADCLLDTSNTSYPFPTGLPGKALSLNDQCRHYNSGIRCTARSLESQCQHLCCENILKVSISSEPAADGTECGPGKSCFLGECLPDENVLIAPST